MNLLRYSFCFMFLFSWLWGISQLLTRDGTTPPALEGKTLSHWTTRWFWKTSLTVKYWLAVFFLAVLWIFHLTLSFPSRFLLRNPLVILWEFLCMREFFSLTAFKFFFLIFELKMFYYNISWIIPFFVELFWGSLIFMYLDG